MLDYPNPIIHISFFFIFVLELFPVVAQSQMFTGQITSGICYYINAFYFLWVQFENLSSQQSILHDVILGSYPTHKYIFDF